MLTRSLKLTFTVLPLLILVSCGGKHPSSLVGVWQSASEGILSVQFVLTLKGDGAALINRNVGINKGVGIFGGTSDSGHWEFADKQLTIRETNGTTNVFTVIARSKTELTLQQKDGSITSFRKVGTP
jgi:hypothetical protein